MSIGFSLIVVLYFGILIYLGYRGYRQTKTAADYMLAGRKVHPVVMALSYGATFISTSAIIGFGGLSSQFGMSLQLLTFFNIAVGIFVAFVFIGKRTRRMGHHLDAHTFPELIGKRYGSVFLQRFSGIVIFLFMPLYSATVLIGGARFVESTFLINYDIALLIFTIIIAAYVIAGGLRGVMYTEALQGGIRVLGVLILVVSTYFQLGGVGKSHEKLSEVYNKVKARVQTEETKAEHIRQYLMEKHGVQLEKAQVKEIENSLKPILKTGDREEQMLQFSLLLREKAPGIKIEKKNVLDVMNRFIYTEIEDRQVTKLEKIGFQGWGETPENFSIFWWILFSTFVLGVGIGVLAQPQLAVRFMTVKSSKELNRAVGVGGIFILIIVGGIYTVGPLSNIFFFEHPGYQTISMAAAGGNMDNVVPAFINAAMPKWFVFLFMLTLLSAAMSTLSSQFHAVGTAVSRDILRKGTDQKEMHQQAVFWSKVGILVGIVITVILGYVLGKGVIARGTAIFFGLTAASFLPLFVAGLYSKKVTRGGAIWSMIAGFSGSLIWMVFFQLKPAAALGVCKALFGTPSLVAGSMWGFVDPIVISLPLSIIVLILGSIFGKKMEPGYVDYCFERQRVEK
jgi:SSS family solute:Na+ symporter